MVNQVQLLLSNAVAASTAENYRSGWNAWVSFTEEYGISPWNPSEANLVGFVVSRDSCELSCDTDSVCPCVVVVL